MPATLNDPVDANDLIIEEDAPYDWLIPGLIERGDRAIITGAEGKGKSTLLRQIGFQAASGVSPFTLDKIQPLKVMLADLENSRAQIRRKLLELDHDMPCHGMFQIAPWASGLDLSNPDYQIAFTEQLMKVKPDLLLIGPMYKMHPGLEEEANSDHLALFLDKLRTEMGFAIIMESHQPHMVITQAGKFRPERPFGSSLWMRWPEFGICLESDGTLRHWRGQRDQREWPEKLVYGDEWPWVVDRRMCQQCGMSLLTDKQERYCSDKCRNAAKQRRHRALAVQPAMELE